ncbi:MAG: alpha-glucan family phosphorylase [Longimicrobiales bacterium]|nr:alpha-glucan family phosphorylase [Longimicrobiales bacterium]
MTSSETLNDLARNLRWDWHAPTRALFRDLDPELWDAVDHNPVALLRRVDPSRLTDPEVERRAETLWQELQSYLEADDTWYRRETGGRDDDEGPLVAYFSAEFGLTECLRIYSGGLGVLAGDHLKSASDLGVPLVAVGALYREGYFKQELDGEGRQTETFPVADFDDLPLRRVTRADGSELRVLVPYPGRTVSARVWRADVGRVPLYLLDTDVPENSDADRRLTARLYGGGQETRIAQEILLGMGGYRALQEMGVEPGTYHMNEGHSAFLALELAGDIMRSRDLDFEAAADEARSRCVFTTHTPVPAGHDRFSEELMGRYLTETAHRLGMDLDQLMELGREEPGEGPFTMTVLAIRLSRATNGVSALHGAVSRDMWHGLWPDRPVDEVPIGHITNGIHVPTWVDPSIAATWGVDPDRMGIDAGTPEPDAGRLWEAHGRRRRALVDYVAGRTGVQLDADVLTVAFARRFATYKRATLLLADLDRLDAILNHPERPVQVLFAGKAHPKDQGGKALIARITEVSRDPRFRGRIVFVPGYGIDVARELVQGADVWLNNPRRPMEASGTSGMKAAMNGVLNLSILDGWWDEAYRGRDEDTPAPGWAIGRAGDQVRTQEAADRADQEGLYRALEEQVAPLFYDRDDAGVPARWVARMQESIRQVAPFFNTHRMLRDYTQRYQAEGQAAPSPTARAPSQI